MGIPPLDFLLYYAGGLLFVILLLFWRRPKKGMRLRLVGGRRVAGGDLKLAGDNPGAERSINVVFNYNGHSWDAYEVLGLPAGSGMSVVEAAFKDSMERVDPGSRPFIQAAYNAIRVSRSA